MTALELAAPSLRCPVCEGSVAVEGAVLACAHGHRFDLARQGYVNLVSGRGGPGTADTAAMVAARESFLAGGHFAPIAAAIDDVIGTGADIGIIVDLAGGTGYYLADLLEHRPGSVGICVDLSTPALRRAAKAHARAAAVGADAWAGLPIASGAADVILSVFGPRNADEIERTLAPDGLLVVVSPTTAHLSELVAALGLVAVDPRKAERQAMTFARFRPLARHTVDYSIALDHDDICAVVGMGPSAVHIDVAEIRRMTERLAERCTVTISVEVATYRR